MSEPVTRAIPTGNVSIPANRRAVVPSGSVSASGKAEPAAGNSLPAVEQPELELLVDELNTTTQTIGRDLRFQVDLDSRRSVIQVLDRETGEVIRQIPPEKVSTFINENGGLAINLLDDIV
ncbi:MAG: flagellar protein FlaG [Gammaproteobacteria bacterium]|nr:flagellar protein FlaG [Gammaproteobacteria bacterium]